MHVSCVRQSRAPCQPFFKAGYWASGDARRLDDPRVDPVTAFLRVWETDVLDAPDAIARQVLELLEI